MDISINSEAYKNSSEDYSEDYLLAQACASGDQRAQKKLYELYAKNMFYICLRYCGDDEVARDLMHDGFVKAFTKLHSFRAEAKLKTWLTRVMANHSINYCKKQARQQFKKIDDVEYALADEDQDIMQKFEQVKTTDTFKVLDTILTLPVGYRTVLSMYALDGYSHKEIAETLGVSQGTTKSQLAKARRMLVKLLNTQENE